MRKNFNYKCVTRYLILGTVFTSKNFYTDFLWFQYCIPKLRLRTFTRIILIRMSASNKNIIRSQKIIIRLDLIIMPSYSQTPLDIF